MRIVCDSHLAIPVDSYLVQTAREIPLYVATLCQDEKKLNALEAMGVNIITTSERQGYIDIKYLMEQLGKMGIDSVLLEGGGTLNYSALEAGIVNRVQVYVAPKIFGGDGRFTPVKGLGVEYPDGAYMFQKPKITVLDEDVLLEYEALRE